MKKIFSIFVLALAAMSASAYNLTSTATEHGSLTFTVGSNSAATTASEGDEVTVTVTADEGYFVQDVTARGYASFSDMQAPRRASSIPVIDGLTMTKGTGNTWTFTMPAAHVEVNAMISEMTAATISFAQTEVSKVFGDADFTNMLTNSGDGTVTYAVTAESKDADCTSDHVATIDGATGCVTITGTGTATVTATVTNSTLYTYSGMTNYNSTTKQATVSYTLTVGKGTITATASGGTYTYDGYSQGITVSVKKPSSGYTIAYSTDNATWSTTKPTWYSCGTYTTYYKVTAPNYNDKTGSAKITINRRSGSISFGSPTSVEKTYGDAAFTKTYSTKTGSGSISYSSSNTSVATVNYSGLVTIVGAGTTTITVSMAQSTNYTSASASYTLTVLPADLSEAIVVLSQYVYDYDGTAKQPAVQVVLLGTKVLTAGTDYVVDYTNNINAGNNTAEANAIGIGNYTGAAAAHFTINAVTTQNGNITIVDGGEDNREVTVFDTGNQQGSTLTPGLEVSTLNYARTLNENDAQAYTVCLPYAPPVSENLKYYTLAECDGTTLSFSEIAGAPMAETPYLVIATTTTDIGQQGVTSVTMSREVSNSSSAGGYVLKGTLSGLNHNDAQGLYILQSGNRWGRVGSDTHAYIPPFRAYIEATTSAPSATLDSRFGDMTTAISGLKATDRDGTERWFDLNGRRIENPATKGIYIRNGRKEIVK